MPSSSHRPVCAVFGETGGGRAEERVGGRKRGRRNRGSGGGDIGQKIDMSSDHPPFLCLSAWWAELPARAPRQPAGAREGTSFPACAACPRRRAKAQNPVLGLLWLRNPGERGNVLPLVMGLVLGQLFSGRLMLPLERSDCHGGGSPGLAWTPGLGKRHGSR